MRKRKTVAYRKTTRSLSTSLQLMSLATGRIYDVNFPVTIKPQNIRYTHVCLYLNMLMFDRLFAIMIFS